MRIVPYLLYLLLVAFHGVVLKEATAVAGVQLNLAAFLVLAVALYKREVTALWFGFAAGLTLGAGYPELVGWHALVLSMLGLVAYHVHRRVNLDSLYAKLLLMFAGVYAHNVVLLLIERVDGFLLGLVSPAATGALYSEVMALVFFVFKEGKVTAQKVRSLF